MEVAHGGYTQIECTLRLLHMAYDMGCDYFHLISGQDYPCRPNREFDKFFEENAGRSYMQIEQPEYHEPCMVHKYPSRVQPWYIRDCPHRDIAIVNFFVRAFNKISQHFFIRKMIPGLWGSWNWFSWHRSLAEYVIREEKENPKFFQRFHHTSCADELIFSTMFHGHEQELNIDGTNALRYINWEKKLKVAIILVRHLLSTKMSMTISSKAALSSVARFIPLFRRSCWSCYVQTYREKINFLVESDVFNRITIQNHLCKSV